MKQYLSLKYSVIPLRSNSYIKYCRVDNLTDFKKISITEVLYRHVDDCTDVNEDTAADKGRKTPANGKQTWR